MESENKNQLSAERVKNLLQQQNVYVTLEQANKIANFMNMLANIVVQDHLRNKIRVPQRRVFS